MESNLRIIVTGLIAQHPHMGGVAWDYLQYAVGLRRLGHDVFYFEDSGEWPYHLDKDDTTDDWIVKDPKNNVAHLDAVMRRFGLGDRWAYRFPSRNEWYGLSDAKRRSVMDSADLVINVSGTIEHPEHYRRAQRLAYIDSDPLFTQVKYLQKKGRLESLIDLHDVTFSFGESFSENMPVTGHRWHPTRHPMVLGEWDPRRPAGAAYSTVMNWTSYEPIEFDGRRYGQKDVEFKRFLNLPSLVPDAKLEIALAQKQHAKWQTSDEAVPEATATFLRENADASPAELLVRAGWNIVDPQDLCPTIDDYRDYITSSKAEWSVAKNGYVAGRPGWFSCRSACYLAAARPVIVQDTGFGEVLPVGEGIIAFTSLEEAAEGIRAVEADYKRHSEAARAIAEEYFDSDKVLGRLVEQAGAVQPSGSPKPGSTPIGQEA